jgi:hypothetical protein
MNATQISQQFVRCALARFTRRDYRQAIRYFDLANRAAPSADLHYNIARSHELLNEYEEAAESYERYLRDKVNAPDRAEVEQRIAQLRDLARRRREAARQRDGRALLTIVVNQPGARVLVDDRQVGTAPLAPGLALSPGTHRLTVEQEGYQRWEGIVRARAGETGRATVTLVEATRFRTQPVPHVASFVLGGLSAASFVAGSAFGIVAAHNGACMNREGPGCIGRDPLSVDNVTRVQCNSVHRLTCARDDWNLASSILIGSGVALATGAVIAWFVERGSGRTVRVRAERAASSPAGR